ncbi:MAG: pyrroline-5-carboxylate reductase [Oscillospiraceae bacterium]
MLDKKIGFIGPGKMAKAIVNGIISTSFISPKNIYIYGRTEEKLPYFAEIGCHTSLNTSESCQVCDIIFLCIKPQNFPEVLQTLQPVVSNKILYVSIAAGLTYEKIWGQLGSKVKLIRAMPNTPLLIGKGATAISGAPNVASEELSTICNVFSSCGTVRIIDEELMNPIINVSGSTPAYLYLFAKHINNYAVEQGIPRETSMQLFCQTLIGSASMLLNTGLSEDELITMVASKGGTTQAALDVFEQGGFKEIIDKALDACMRRAEELGK